jgi:hypothetical protein
MLRFDHRRPQNYDKILHFYAYLDAYNRMHKMSPPAAFGGGNISTTISERPTWAKNVTQGTMWQYRANALHRTNLVSPRRPAWGQL